jgi:hypothetical protein
MRKCLSTVLTVVTAVAAAGALAACSQTATLSPSSSEGDAVGRAQTRMAFTQFSDIPIPSGSTMDMEKSHIFGGAESWFGQLVIRSPNGPNDMFEFYHQQMPEFGWREITSVRAATSVLTYVRAGRVATLQITKRTFSLGDSEVTVTVAPERPVDKPADASSNAGSSRRAPAPVRRQ